MAEGWAAQRARLVFGLDTRSLAVMRVGLGLLQIVDLGVRSTYLNAFYTDAGTMPLQSLWGDGFANKIYISLHAASGSATWVGALFLLQGLAALAMILGWHTRLATVICWVLMVSLQVRNPLVLSSGDVVFRLLLFWSMFLPLGARSSMDATRSPRTPPPDHHLSAATVALASQLAFIYIFTAILKNGGPWWDGTAVAYTLQLDHFATPLAVALRDLPMPVVHALTWGTLAWEIVGPYLLLVPFLFGPVRTGVVLGFMLMHVCFSACLEIGIFSAVCIAGWSALLPGWLWDKVGWPQEGGAKLKSSIPSQIFVSLALLTVLWWNVGTVAPKSWPTWTRVVPSALRDPGRVMRLDQKWEMFAPYPMKDDGWFVADATLRGGRHVDLLTQAEVTWDKPELISATYPDQRWRKYMRNVWLKKYKKTRLWYGKYLCRTWNADHHGVDMVTRFTLFFNKEKTRLNEPMTVEKVTVWNHDCFKNAEAEADPTKVEEVKPQTAKDIPGKVRPPRLSPLGARPDLPPAKEKIANDVEEEEQSGED